MMKIKIVIALLLMTALFCVSSLGMAVAAEPVSDSEECSVDVSLKNVGLYEITVNGRVFLYNDLTGKVTNSDGEVIAKITTQNSNAELYALTASKPTSIQHGMTVGSRWIYSYSQWSTVECYVQAQDELISAITSFFVSAGLTPLIGSEAADAIGDAAGEFLAWLNRNGLDINENAFYVRSYVYGNRYILSNFAEIYQGYCTDYTPLNVITYDQDIKN